MVALMRSRWAAVGAAVAVSVGAGGVGLTQAGLAPSPDPVFVTLDAPCRLVDTRPGDNNVGPKSTPISAGEANAYEIQVTGGEGECTGALAVPADATAVALNVTAISPNAPSGRSFFTVYPADAPLPDTSNLNFVTGQPPVPNKVDVGLSAGGAIKIFNFDGTAHAAVDVFGYYVDHDHDDRYYTEGEVDAALDDKADSAAVYTRAEAYDLFAPQWLIVDSAGQVTLASPGLETTQVFRPPSEPVGIYCLQFPAEASVDRHGVIGTVEDEFGGVQAWTMSVNSTINTECSENDATWTIAVKTFNGSTPTDARFRLLIPRATWAP